LPRCVGRCWAAPPPPPDAQPPPLDLIGRFCEAVDTWLAADSQNVVAIHCKAGKGRTGCLIAAYLVHCGFAPNAEAALAWFGRMRTSNGKGVTIPSQMRYVHYYEHVLRYGPPPYIPTFKVSHFRMVSVPQIDSTGGCTPNIAVYCDDELVWDFKTARATAIATAEAERAAAAAAAQRAFEALAQAEAAATAAAEEEAERQWGAQQAAEEDSAMQRRRAQSYGGVRSPTVGSKGVRGGSTVSDDGELQEDLGGGELLGSRGPSDGSFASPAVAVSDGVLQQTARNVGWVPFEMDPSTAAEQRRGRLDSIVGRTGGSASPRSTSPRGGSDSDGAPSQSSASGAAAAGAGVATAAERRYAQLSQRGLIGMSGAKAPLKRYHRFGAASANVLESEGALVMTPTHARRAAASAYAAAARAGLIADSLGAEGLRAYDGTEEYVDMDCTLLDLRMGGNVRVEITHDPEGAVGGAAAGTGGGLGKTIATFWLHTAFIEGNALRLARQAVDKANKDKSGKFAPRFAVEVYGHPVPGAPLPPRAFKPTSASASLQSGVGGAKPQMRPITSAQGGGSLQGLVAGDGPVKRGGGGTASKLPWGSVETAAASRKAEQELAARRTHMHSIRSNTQLWGALQQQRQVRAQVIKALNEEEGKGGAHNTGSTPVATTDVPDINWDSDDDREITTAGVEADGGAGGLLDALEGRAADSVRITLQEPNFWSGMWTDTAVAAANVRGAYRSAGAPLPGDKPGGQGAREVAAGTGQHYTMLRGVAAQHYVSVPSANSGMYGPPPAPMVLPGDAGEVDILGLPVSAQVRLQEEGGEGGFIAADSSDDEEPEQFDDYEQQLDEDGELLQSESGDSDSSDSERGVSIDINEQDEAVTAGDAATSGGAASPEEAPADDSSSSRVPAARSSKKSGSIIEMPMHMQQQVQVRADGTIVSPREDGPMRRPSAAVGSLGGMPVPRHRSDADEMPEGMEGGEGGGPTRSVPMHVAKLRGAGGDNASDGTASVRPAPVRRTSLAKDSHARGLLRGGDASFRSPAATGVLSSRGRGRRRTMLPKGGGQPGAEAAAKAKAAAAAAAAAAMPSLQE